jgi:hypothetical protein
VHGNRPPQERRLQQQQRPTKKGSTQRQRVHAASGKATNFTVGVGAGLLGVSGKGGKRGGDSTNYNSEFVLVDDETSAFADLKARFIADAASKALAPPTAYDKSKSFFDSISSSASDRMEQKESGTRKPFKERMAAEEEVNLQTFGVRSLNTKSSDRRRGGRRGGYHGHNNNGRTVQNGRYPKSRDNRSQQQRRTNGQGNQRNGNQRSRWNGNQRNGNRRPVQGQQQQQRRKGKNNSKQQRKNVGTGGWSTVSKKKSVKSNSLKSESAATKKK